MKYADPVFPALFTQNVATLRQFDRDLVTALGSWSMSLKGILDRGIAVGDNLDAVVVEFTSSVTPDAENTVAHGLGKVPTHFIVTSLNKAAIVYKGSTAFTSTNIYLKVNVASVAVKIIVL